MNNELTTIYSLLTDLKRAIQRALSIGEALSEVCADSIFKRYNVPYSETILKRARDLAYFEIQQLHRKR